MKNLFKIHFLIFTLVICGIFATQADAATLSFYPSTGKYSTGGIFTVQVLVNSEGSAVNAYSGDISYPSDILSLTSISKSGTIVNFWASDPGGAKGLAHFEGITVDPGYSGSSGKIITLTFKARNEGTANVKFSSSSVLANDGMGTNVLNNSGTAVFTIGEGKKTEEQVLLSPNLFSESHPDQESWYSNRVAKISWELPSSITSVSYTTNANPSGLPYAYFGLVKGRTTPILSDGVWYTHVRFRTNAGVGPVARFKTMIDATVPTSVEVEVVENEKSMDEAWKVLSLKGTDALSGIGSFGVSIDGKEETLITANDNTASYKTENLKRGTHTYTVRAYDRASNYLEKTGEFNITHIEPPVIKEYPRELRDEDFLIIRGTADPDSKVVFSMIRQIEDTKTLFGKVQYITVGDEIKGEVITDHFGNFTFAYDERLAYGVYRIRAKVVDGEATSAYSEEIFVQVVQGIWMKIVNFVMIPSVAIGILALFGLIFLIIFVRLYKKYHSIRNDLTVNNVQRIRE